VAHDVYVGCRSRDQVRDDGGDLIDAPHTVLRDLRASPPGFRDTDLPAANDEDPARHTVAVRAGQPGDERCDVLRTHVYLDVAR
jgi:hypothetical protein